MCNPELSNGQVSAPVIFYSTGIRNFYNPAGNALKLGIKILILEKTGYCVLKQIKNVSILSE